MQKGSPFEKKIFLNETITSFKWYAFQTLKDLLLQAT